jgi:predicted outer membrane repeat protein
VDSVDDSDISDLSVFEADSVDDSDIAESSESLLKVSSEDNSNVEIMGSDSENEDEKSSELINRIQNAQANEIITIEPGTYRIHNLTLAKNITLQGKGYNEVVIDGEYLGSVFLIHDPEVFVNFYNLTIIHGLTDNFGGGICIETGNAHVNNCVFINNSALNVTNGGAISNYGDEDYRSYLLVNNSVFLGNHADHDGGAITTCYATSDIYNSVFMNNSARRDGGAIRVSIFGLGFVQDCVFMYNHADEWAGEGRKRRWLMQAHNNTIGECLVPRRRLLLFLYTKGAMLAWLAGQGLSARCHRTF